MFAACRLQAAGHTPVPLSTNQASAYRGRAPARNGPGRSQPWPMSRLKHEPPHSTAQFSEQKPRWAQTIRTLDPIPMAHICTGTPYP